VRATLKNIGKLSFYLSLRSPFNDSTRLRGGLSRDYYGDVAFVSAIGHHAFHKGWADQLSWSNFGAAPEMVRVAIKGNITYGIQRFGFAPITDP
jgi:hypothetical protein